MIAYAVIDANGFPTGGGIARVLPEGAVALSGPFSTTDLPKLRHVDGVWSWRTDLPEPVPPLKEEQAAWEAAMLDRARVQAVERINARVGALRRRIYTDIPGQDALYLEKRAEAQAYVRQMTTGAEPETLRDFPFLENEVGITAPNAWALAQLWLNRSDQFRRVGAATEKARMRAIIAVGQAPDEPTIQTIEATFNEALNGLPL